MFKRQIGAILFGMVVAWGGLATLTVTPALAVPVQSFPPDIQQWLRSAWARLPADARQQDLVAIKALSPAQAEKAITNVRHLLRSVPMDIALQLVLLQDKLRTSLPPASRQAFVNGGWGVSPAEEQFAQQVIQAAIARTQQGGPQSPSEGGLDIGRVDEFRKTMKFQGMQNLCIAGQLPCPRW